MTNPSENVSFWNLESTAAVTAAVDVYQTDATTKDPSGLTPIHYIIIVLLFYMGGLTILIIKYVQGENEEARYEHYYVEYVKRPQFNRPSLMSQIRETPYEDNHTAGKTTSLTANLSFYHSPTSPSAPLENACISPLLSPGQGGYISTPLRGAEANNNSNNNGNCCEVQENRRFFRDDTRIVLDSAL